VTRGRIAGGLAAGLILGVLLGGWGLSFGRGRMQTEKQVRTATVRLVAITRIVERARAAGAEVQPLLERFAAEQPNLGPVRVIEGRNLLASTHPDDTGERAAPRKLQREEKDLFDQAKRLATVAAANRAGAAEQGNEIEVRGSAAAGLSLAGPFEQDGEIAGAVLLEAPGAAGHGGTPWLLALAVVIVPTLLMLAVYPLLAQRRAAPAALGAVLLVAGVAVYGVVGARLLEQDVTAASEAVADEIRAQKNAAEQTLVAAGIEVEPPLGDGGWDLDALRRDRGLATAEGVERAAVEARSDVVASDTRNGSILVVALALALGAFVAFGGAWNTWVALRDHATAYTYVAPAMIGMLLLVFFPFFYGVVLSFTDADDQNVDTMFDSPAAFFDLFTGLENYEEIVTDFSIVKTTETGREYNYENFYWTLMFTIVWTVSNVTIGVSVGLFLALILNTRGLKVRPIYRILFILPWAVPNYITALIWKGMFHQQFGVVNQVLQMFGREAVAWFDTPLTSFVTVLATNGWLSFPFMMVVSLGALQSIPSDLYEAARVDGATRWMQFRSITLPSLKPALVPAVILSVIWTFNQFNIIYLVSEGQPGGATEILITDAYKLAFEQYRYGYAAAYSTVIFAILFAYGIWQNRMARTTEGA